MDLERLPDNAADHLWADYIELLSLVNQDGFTTKNDVLDRIRDDDDFFTGTEEENEDELTAMPVSELRDREERRIDDRFRHLSYRQAVFGDFYPFYVSDDGEALHRQLELTSRHKFYIFLLLASNLRCLSRQRSSRITSTFEVISWAALKGILPASAEVHLFRPVGELRAVHSRYSGNLLRRVKALASDLRERILIGEENLSPQDSGDGGLDIVGWVPVGDETTGGLLCIFAQCACTEEWVVKQHSSKVDSWRPMMTFTAPPSNAIFIPFCFRNSNGEWWQPQDIHQSIVFDRVRLIYFLREDYSILEGYSAYQVVEEVLAYRESLV